MCPGVAQPPVCEGLTGREVSVEAPTGLALCTPQLVSPHLGVPGTSPLR